MAAQSLRLFIAIELPHQDTLSRLQTALKVLDEAHAVRWVTVQGIHLTLKFLGETPASQQDAIAKALNTATRGFGAFDLAVQGVGCFPNPRSPRVFWAGISGDTEMLSALRDSVEQYVAPLGFPTESRPFSPHLTLGRARKDANRADLAAIGRQLETLVVNEPAAWRVRAVSLMRSELRPSGAIYTRVAEASLDHPGQDG